MEVDTLVSASQWSEQPLTAAGDGSDIDVKDIIELNRRSRAGIEIGGTQNGTRHERSSTTSQDGARRRGLESCTQCSATPGPDQQVRRYNRARVPAPFPGAPLGGAACPTSWCCPRTTEQVAEVVKLANRLRVPVVPRAGGTGLDRRRGAAARTASSLDVKRMDQIKEIDLEQPHGAPSGTGINMLKLNEQPRPARPDLPRRPGVLPVLAGRRAHRHQRLVAASGRATGTRATSSAQLAST